MTNVDAQEIAKFSKLAHQWWDVNGPCKPLHLLNPVRLEFIQNQCDLSQGFILDVGCGGGILTESLSTLNSHVWGIDASFEAIEAAKAHALSHHMTPTYVHTTIEEFAAIHPSKFNVITCMEMLEHVPNPSSILQTAASLLTPGGHLFISTLNRTPRAFFEAIMGAEYILNLLPKGTHSYANFIRPSELSQWAQQAGFSLKQFSGIGHDLFAKHFYLNKNIHVNYLAHFIKE